MKRFRYELFCKSPNMITFSRIIMTCAIVIICNQQIQPVYFVAVLSLFIFLSDIVDGFWARKFHLETRRGAIFDVFADTFYILLTSISFQRLHVVPFYFSIMILLELVVFVVTSRIMDHTNCIFVFDYAGRILAMVYYVIPICMYVSYFHLSWLYIFIANSLMPIIVVSTLGVIVYRILLCRNYLFQYFSEF